MARFEELTISQLTIDGAAAVATGDSVELHQPAGIVVTKPLTTVANQNYDITIVNSLIRATDMVLASVAKGTNTVGPLTISKVIPADGSVLIGVKNNDAADPLNGTVRVSYILIRLA